MPAKPAVRRKVSKTMSNLRANIAQQASKEWSPLKGSELEKDYNVVQ